MLRGDLGQPPGGWLAEISKRVLGDEPPCTARPASLMPPADLTIARAAAERRRGRTLSKDEFASYLMYPQVFERFADALRQYGPVATLPTPVYFYGMAPGDEISVEIDRGKTLVITLQAIGEMEADGSVQLFFELNGQPRIVTMANRRASAIRPQRRMADTENDRHVAAPMPGMVSMLHVASGEKVGESQLLMILDAMKVEVSVFAKRAGTITELLVSRGQAIDAKDLLLVLD